MFRRMLYVFVFALLFVPAILWMGLSFLFSSVAVLFRWIFTGKGTINDISEEICFYLFELPDKIISPKKNEHSNM